MATWAEEHRAEWEGGAIPPTARVEVVARFVELSPEEMLERHRARWDRIAADLEAEAERSRAVREDLAIGGKGVGRG